MIELDGFGKPCPMPLVMVKKELDKGEEVAIQVDNETAVKNITRLVEGKDLAYSLSEIEGGYRIEIGGSAQAGETAELKVKLSASATSGATSGYSVFVGKNVVGAGDEQLGFNLMKMALFTLNQADVVPTNLLFMNSGVTLLCGDEPQIIESVQDMIDKGTSVLVCGTCLDFYEVKDKLKVGQISNMYEILERMHESSKVITL